MFTHLLVPLDGSPMAEQALPVAAAIAGKCGARVTLLHVLEEKPPRQVHGQRHLKDRQAAEEYLECLANELQGRDARAALKVDWHVHPQPTRSTAEGLCFHSDEYQPDLVVMCSHGGVRIRDRLVGNIAQQLAQRQKAPVLLLRPTADGGIQLPFRSILAPLDGQPDHEQGLGAAVKIAKLFGAALHLVTAVSPAPEAKAAATYLPGTVERLLDVQEQEAAAYLERLAERLKREGPPTTTGVRRGDPSRCLIAAARQAQADLVALTTHGKAGTKAFWSGSLTPKLLRRMRQAFLLSPVR